VHDRSLSQEIRQALHNASSEPAVVLRKRSRCVEIDASAAAASLSSLEYRAYESCSYAIAPSSRLHEKLSKPWCQLGSRRQAGGHEGRGAKQLSVSDGNENRWH
jgi:hypothetical protein